MKTKVSNVITALACAAVLLVAAAASFISMNYFDRNIFDNYLPFQASFGALAVLMLAAAFLKNPLLSLILSIACTAGMWFLSPAFAALFLPVALQAVLYDAAKNERKGAAAAYFLALTAQLAALCLWFYIRKADLLQLPDYHDGIPAERFLYVALSALALAFCVWLFIRSVRQKTAVKKKNGAPSRRSAADREAFRQLKKKNAAAKKRGASVYLICAVNLAAQIAYSILFFHTGYCKVLFFSHLLFFIFLEYRKEPLLRLHAWLDRLLDPAFSPAEDSE